MTGSCLKRKGAILDYTLFELFSFKTSMLFKNSSACLSSNLILTVCSPLLGLVKQNQLQNYYPNIVKIFSDDPDTKPEAKCSPYLDKMPNTAWKVKWSKLYGDFWKNNIINPSPVIERVSLSKANAASCYESTMCHDSTIALANKYRAAKDKSVGHSLPHPRKANLEISNGAIANCKAEVGPKCNSTSDIPICLDTVKYGSKAALKSVVEKIKQALDKGYKLYCGLLSGIKHEMTPLLTTKKKPDDVQFPNPEHYILLLGHDDNKFVFWDSDPTVSNIEVTGWGQGLGVLFFIEDSNSDWCAFSTACTKEDLVSVNGDGEHTVVKHRHRYQVYSVQTLPT
jgi:hypothetical protein